ncbi:hypothetical protein CN378_17960 [Bacillus sp. AFS015802]|jgi:hypothetical protein|uniref:Uncharacterized protein n=1 Tax=Rossellomorea vietnamensis TaxID=218284 RepID=A0A0N8GG72_9BACI|nr:MULTISPECIES: DNA modification system-associated small protein [Bacillaceae]KPL57690.1 hypothetical protein AM506_20905 [Rossellomorea vietnamensis]MDX8342623.1 DNA modification system-associated small protein [Rossellomorea sp. YZS02]PFA62926.1 hypothetical protein CN378_17960 [Bacillus sp. AFS015802]
MKDMKRRETELMSKVCTRNNVPPKLGRLLVKLSEREAYENNSQQTRIKEYQSLIDFHFKENQ